MAIDMRKVDLNEVNASDRVRWMYRTKVIDSEQLVEKAKLGFSSSTYVFYK